MGLRSVQALFLAAAWLLCPASAGAQAPSAKATTAKANSSKKAAPAAPVNLNTATADELTRVPGIGDATAKKIVAGRPYSSVADLEKTGISPKQLEQIAPMVMVKSGGAGTMPVMGSAPGGVKMAPSAPMQPAAGTPHVPPSLPPSLAGDHSEKSIAATPYQAPPAPGMVWVNKETKMYHKQGDRWYGRTKQGVYMTEANAIKNGYKAAAVK